MAVAFEMRFKGGTLEQYDRVMGLMGFTHGGATPQDALFHWAAATEDGIIVVDVWDNADAFNTFAAEKIGPLTAHAGFEGPPEITSYEVHNFLAAS
jgi:hypothetical protein